MPFPLLQLLDDSGSVVYDFNDGVTTRVHPDEFDLGIPERERTLFAPSGTDGAIKTKRTRLGSATMSWLMDVNTTSVYEARRQVGEINRLLETYTRMQFQHDAGSDLYYIELVDLDEMPLLPTRLHRHPGAVCDGHRRRRVDAGIRPPSADIEARGDLLRRQQVQKRNPAGGSNQARSDRSQVTVMVPVIEGWIVHL
jgi:hypothetical protein